MQYVTYQESVLLYSHVQFVSLFAINNKKLLITWIHNLPFPSRKSSFGGRHDLSAFVMYNMCGPSFAQISLLCLINQSTSTAHLTSSSSLNQYHICNMILMYCGHLSPFVYWLFKINLEWNNFISQFTAFRQMSAGKTGRPTWK